MSSGRRARPASLEPTSRLDFWAGRIGNALLVASIVFAAFLGYTFSAPTVFRSSALLVVDLPGGKQPRLQDAPLIERRVKQEVLAVAALGRLRAELGLDKLGAGFEVHTLDGRGFSVAFRDADRFRARRVTTELTRRTAELLPGIVAPQQSAEQALEAARQKHLEELLSFLAQHPEVGAGPAAPARTDTNQDPALVTLKAERTHVEQRLAQLSSLQHSSLRDNPYQDEDQVWSNPAKLRRRLSEIDRLLEARHSALARNQPGQSQVVPATLAAEWQRLLASLQGSPSAGPSPPPRPVAVRITRAASLPRWPIQPNRGLLVWLGALCALVAGAIAALRPRSRPVGRELAERRASLPAIARALPLVPRTRAENAPMALALMKPAEPLARRSIPVKFSAQGLAARRSASWQQELGPPDPAVATTVPLPQAARETLMYGSGELGESLAVTLRLDEPGDDQRAGEPRALGVEAIELGDWQPDAKLSSEARRALAEELSAVHEPGGMIVGVLGSPRDEKSLVAAELALALAELAVDRVLLLEGDLAHPISARTMSVKMPRSFGFSRQLEAYTQGRLPAWTVVRCRPTLDVLGEGIMRTPGLLVGPLFAASVARLKTLYDFVVIDGPSLHDTADCRALDPILDATIFVHRPKRAAELSRAATLFARKRFSWTIARSARASL